MAHLFRLVQANFVLDERAEDAEVVAQHFEGRWVESPYGASTELHSDAGEYCVSSSEKPNSSRSLHSLLAV